MHGAIDGGDQPVYDEAMVANDWRFSNMGNSMGQSRIPDSMIFAPGGCNASAD